MIHVGCPNVDISSRRWCVEERTLHLLRAAIIIHVGCPNVDISSRRWCVEERTLHLLKQLAPENRKIIGIDIKTVEYGWPIGMPTCRSMGKGLYEVRSSLQDGTIARVLFCIYQEHMVLLHGFIKKTQKTPKQDLDLALTRKKNLEAEK